MSATAIDTFDMERSSYGTYIIWQRQAGRRRRVYEDTNKVRAKSIRDALEFGDVVPNPDKAWS